MILIIPSVSEFFLKCSLTWFTHRSRPSTINVAFIIIYHSMAIFQMHSCMPGIGSMPILSRSVSVQLQSIIQFIVQRLKTILYDPRHLHPFILCQAHFAYVCANVLCSNSLSYALFKILFSTLIRN